jgi:hypothetical protein
LNCRSNKTPNGKEERHGETEIALRSNRGASDKSRGQTNQKGLSFTPVHPFLCIGIVLRLTRKLNRNRVPYSCLLMTIFRTNQGIAALTVSLMLLAAAVPGRAQQTTPSNPATSADQTTPSSLLTLEEALKLATLQASAFQQANLNERIAAEDVRQARTAFLPHAIAPLSYL